MLGKYEKLYAHCNLSYVLPEKVHLLQLGQGEEPFGNRAGESSRIYSSAYWGVKITKCDWGKNISLTNDYREGNVRLSIVHCIFLLTLKQGILNSRTSLVLLMDQANCCLNPWACKENSSVNHENSLQHWSVQKRSNAETSYTTFSLFRLLRSGIVPLRWLFAKFLQRKNYTWWDKHVIHFGRGWSLFAPLTG